MKTRETRNHIMNSYDNVIKVRYCGMQVLLQDKSPDFYTSNGDGWSADIYYINPFTCIVTGRKTFGNIEIPYETLRQYELKAKGTSTEEERNELINELLSQFVPNYKGIW